MELNDKGEGKPGEEQVALARDLILNPPKYRPRTTSKATPADHVAEPAEADPEHGIEVFEGLPIRMAFPDGRPRIHGLVLGRRLGYGRQREIRALIKDLIAGGYLVFDDQRGAAPRGPWTTGYWLTEEQALFDTTQAGTPIARTITLQVVRAFVAVRHALNKSILDKELVSRFEAALGPLFAKSEQIETRLAALESSGPLGAHSLLLIPQVEVEDFGHSMESMVEELIKKGFNLAKKDDTLRDFAAKLRLIGDPTYGFWNAHNDRLARSLSESWRFSETGMQALEPHMLRFSELKAQYEAADKSLRPRACLRSCRLSVRRPRPGRVQRALRRTAANSTDHRAHGEVVMSPVQRRELTPESTACGS